MQVADYNLLLDMDFEGLKFKGRLLIKLNAEQDVVLNSVGLDIFECEFREAQFFL